MSKDGGEAKRWVLAGNRLRLSAHHNKILEAYLKAKGVADSDIMINYTPFGHSDWQTIVSTSKKFGSAGKKTAVVSTINGDANVPFYKELGNQGVKATDIPVVAFSSAKKSFAGLDTKPLLGHLAAWNYFQSIKSPINDGFIKNWQTFNEEPQEGHQTIRWKLTSSASHVGEGGREGRHDRSGQGDRRAARHRGAEPHRRHLQDAAQPPTSPSRSSSARCGRTVSSTWCGRPPASSPATPGPNFLPGSKDLEADWVTLKCGNYNTVTKKCGGS